MEKLKGGDGAVLDSFSSFKKWCGDNILGDSWGDDFPLL